MADVARRQREKPREANDFYKTPPECTQALLSVETIPPGVIWEPACGDGAISKVLRRRGHTVLSTDLVDRGFGEPRRDFLMETDRPEGVNGIITNPPFKLAADFVLHAQALRIPYVAMLLRLAWLEGSVRHQRVFLPHPPSRVWVFSKRQTLWRGDEEPTGSGVTPYAWFIWCRAASKITQLGWV